MDNISEPLFKEFSELVAQGNEEDVRDFLVNNLKKFPQDVQEKIASAFFQEALMKKANDLEAIASFQKQGIEMIDELEKGKRQLEDKQKLLDIKGGIK